MQAKQESRLLLTVRREMKYDQRTSHPFRRDFLEEFPDVKGQDKMRRSGDSRSRIQIDVFETVSNQKCH
jgi:hypothetical protein